MKRKELLLVFFLAFSLLLVISSAFLIKGTNYKMKGVISSGGGNLTGAYGLKLAVGQPVIGITSGNCRACFGFFCLLAPMGENTMNFTGQLNYSTGKPVANSLINITIKNETLGFERNKAEETNENGIFFVRIGNLPTEVMNSNFKIMIRVTGDVEAIYECYYDKETGQCG